MTSNYLNDADSHIMELPDFLTACADPDVRDRLPAILPGGDNATIDGLPPAGVTAHSVEHIAQLKALGSRILTGPKWYAALGAFNCAERGMMLDLLDIRRQIVFSSFAAASLTQWRDIDLRYGGVRAFNRAIKNFVSGDSRLVGVGLLVLDDPARTIRELELALRDGLRVFMLPSDSPGRSPGHVDHDPIWARLEEARGAFVLHVGSSKLSIDADWMNDGRPDRRTARGGAEVVGSKDMTAVVHSAERFLSVLILDGVLERFPRLMFGVIEQGASWVPGWMKLLDSAMDAFRKNEERLQKLSLRPSDYVRRQVRVTPYPAEDVGWIAANAGPEVCLFSSDYPHVEGGRNPIKRFEASLANASPETKRRFYGGNMAQLMGPMLPPRA
jgi:uncharacterized protein